MKNETRIKVSYSVDKATAKEFSKEAERLAVNRSALIEKLMERWIKENKERDNIQIRKGTWKPI